jgi:DNA-binding NarL/FixJ family response regulator
MPSSACVSESFTANTDETSIQLAIADDYPLLIFGIAKFLTSCPDIALVTQCTRFDDLLTQMPLTHPKIILLGCETSLDRLPQQLFEITRRDPEARIIVFTGNEDLGFHEEALRNGARGVILKTCAPELIAKSVREVHRGGLCLDRALTDRILGALMRREQAESPPEATGTPSLTGREIKIICRLCEGMDNKEIAQELYVSNATVAHGLTSIYRKFGVANRTELLLYTQRNPIAALRAAQNRPSRC